MKLPFLALLFGCFINVSNLHAETIKKPQWIAISPKILNEMTKKKVRPFVFKESIKGNNETFFLVENSELLKISQFVHHNFKRCGGYRVLSNTPKKMNIVNKSIPPVVFGEFWPNELDRLIKVDYSITRENEVLDFYSNISTDYMNSVIEHLSSYHTRYYDSPEGIASQEWIAKEWSNLTQIRSDIKVELFKHQNFKQRSVILTVEGSDPKLKDQIIILGGHGDSINCDDPKAGLRAPGADDNAAGVAVLSDIIKTIVEKNYRPKRSLQFIVYAAEEVGLQGSAEIAHKYHQEQKQVIGVMQFDGVNFTGKTYDMVLIADHTYSEQNIFNAKLIDYYVHANWTWDKCEYACSDHFSWSSEGYRVSFPGESILNEQDPYIHTAEDTFDKSNNSSSHATFSEKLGMAFLIELDK